MSKKNLTKNITKIRIITCFVIFNIISISNNVLAQDNDLKVDWFNIIPELTEEKINSNQEAITSIWQSWWKVWEKYNEIASSSDFSTSQQITTWIMNWDTIMNYLVFIVQFLSQLWLVVWFWFIMYAWYKYMLSVFDNGKTPSSTITNAIIWIIIVIFSYAIMKILTALIGIS